jgi:hypothetical protein
MDSTRKDGHQDLPGQERWLIRGPFGGRGSHELQPTLPRQWEPTSNPSKGNVDALGPKTNLSKAAQRASTGAQQVQKVIAKAQRRIRNLQASECLTDDFVAAQESDNLTMTNFLLGGKTATVPTFFQNATLNYPEHHVAKKKSESKWLNAAFCSPSIGTPFLERTEKNLGLHYFDYAAFCRPRT